ncbi:MAG TPA: hypothetical protein VGK14_12470 [Novimethylophilus sp.]|uniref:hypothetical protein n=1 Tax=Novimethylophilus sp. TaxID=2137426 RepID=UPI002F40461D
MQFGCQRIGILLRSQVQNFQTVAVRPASRSRQFGRIALAAIETPCAQHKPSNAPCALFQAEA